MLYEIIGIGLLVGPPAGPLNPHNIFWHPLVQSSSFSSRGLPGAFPELPASLFMNPSTSKDIKQEQKEEQQEERQGQQEQQEQKGTTTGQWQPGKTAGTRASWADARVLSQRPTARKEKNSTHATNRMDAHRTITTIHKH